MSRRAMVMTCNKGYEFGMISTINAQRYFKTECEFEIAYEDFSDEDRARITDAFDGRVHWTPLPDLLGDFEDKRTNKTYPINRFWIGYWLLASRLLKTGLYDSVCVTQADQFTFVNLDHYFDLAEIGYLVLSEWDQKYISAEELPFGDDKAIWNREQCAVFDNLNFIGPLHIDLPMQVVQFQAEDAFRDESNHSVIALNRAACVCGTRGTVIGLPGRVWLRDMNWHDSRLVVKKDTLWDSTGLQIKGIHNRWWQDGRAKFDLSTQNQFHEVLKHNYNTTKTFMERFNDMTKTAKSENFVAGVL